jgi:hypothetical protein
MYDTVRSHFAGGKTAPSDEFEVREVADRRLVRLGGEV